MAKYLIEYVEGLQTCKYRFCFRNWIKKKNNSILELYFEIFLNEIENLIRRGIIKRYKRVEKNEFSLKGKMILSKKYCKEFNT